MSVFQKPAREGMFPTSHSLQAWVWLGPQGSDGEKGVQEGTQQKELSEPVARPGPLPRSEDSVKN